ncbi:MAG: ATP-dependent Clp protease adaptor ClpS [Desulfomonile tiedjei]|nr:ATP-dependent Clp protease adaptor ClpS [Desulfomonile tiedjei]
MPCSQMEGFECYTTRRVSPIRLGGEPDDERSRDTRDLYEVRIIDNDHNTYQEVIEISMIALGVSEEEAFAIAWEVDHSGSCAVARAPRDTAEAVADVIRMIGIEVQVNRMGGEA